MEVARVLEPRLQGCLNPLPTLEPLLEPPLEPASST